MSKIDFVIFRDFRHFFPREIFDYWKSPKFLILSFESHETFFKRYLQVTKNFIFATWKSQKIYCHALKWAKIKKLKSTHCARKKCVREMDTSVIQKMFDHLKPKIHKANESGLGTGSLI